ncbi:MAG: DUF1800 domain-containing protein [Burkholderiaceae bacterium]
MPDLYAISSPAHVPAVSRRTALAAGLAALAWRPVRASGPAGDPQSEALHVLQRLAFGPAPGDLARVAGMGVDAWIAEQLQPAAIALPATLAARLAALESPRLSDHELVQRYRQAERAAKAAAAAGREDDAASQPRTAERRERRQLLLQVGYEAGEARLARALASPRQLEEVLVDFWFDHFNVYQGKGLDRVLVESYEREAIRPHVLGRFRAMLGATAKHPAMLFYLDNWQSVAPGYQPRRGKASSGLNENYAREVMELHTLGVDGGYTQRDVTELARILTGWTLAPARARRGEQLARDPASLFAFDPERHDMGTKTWLGHTVPPSGIGEGEFALDVLARHPATARHVCTQLARRFVADAPPAALVDRLARRWQETDGDLRAVMQALVASPEFRDPVPSKFKTPYEYVVSAVRASGVDVANVRPLLGALREMGQPLYGCQTPDGWKDTEADWLNPSAITQRVGFATALAAGRLPLARVDDPALAGGNGQQAMERQVDRAQDDASRAAAGSTPPVDADALLAALGPAIGPRTRAAVADAAPALRAALVLGSPDFMRR